MNPITKKYLQQIEEKYGGTKSASIESRNSPDDISLYQKYKEMRDTAIDIGKWIKGTGSKKNSKKDAASAI